MFVPKGPVDNKWALVRVMAWRRTGDKPLPEAMLTWFTDTHETNHGRVNQYDFLFPGNRVIF